MCVCVCVRVCVCASVCMGRMGQEECAMPSHLQPGLGVVATESDVAFKV